MQNRLQSSRANAVFRRAAASSAAHRDSARRRTHARAARGTAAPSCRTGKHGCGSSRRGYPWPRADRALPRSQRRSYRRRSTPTAAPLRERRITGSGTSLAAVCHFLANRSTTSLVLRRVLGVAAVLVVPRAAHEVSAARMHSGQRPLRDAVAVARRRSDETPSRPRAPLGRQHLAAIGLIGRIPVELAGTSNRSCRCRDPTARSPAFAAGPRDRTPSTASSKHSRGSRGNSNTCFVSPCDA